MKRNKKMSSLKKRPVKPKPLDLALKKKQTKKKKLPKEKKKPGSDLVTSDGIPFIHVMLELAAEKLNSLKDDVKEEPKSVVPNGADPTHKAYGGCSWCKGAMPDSCYFYRGAAREQGGMGDYKSPMEYKRPICIDCISSMLQSTSTDEEKLPIPEKIHYPYIHLKPCEVGECKFCFRSQVGDDKKQTMLVIRYKRKDGKRVDMPCCNDCCEKVALFW